MTPFRLACAALLAGSAISATASPTLSPLAPPLTAARLPTKAAWATGDVAQTLTAIAGATPADRQSLRWSHALALLGDHRPDAAVGVLEVMLQDEPALAQAPLFRLTLARAHVETGHAEDALSYLEAPALAGNAEACLLRLEAYSSLDAAGPALAQLPCAKPALAARKGIEREPGLLAAAAMALALKHPAAALHFLSFAPTSPRTQVLRGEASLQLGRFDEAARLLAPVTKIAPDPFQARAEALLIEADYRRGKLKAVAALAQVERLRFRWRGDRTERELMLQSWTLALAAGKAGAALDAASDILNYNPSEPRIHEILRIVANNFQRWLSPDSKVPLPLAAGLLWDHRDLLPNGPEGDALVRQLATRLQDEGLHARAADLLDHQMASRAKDVAQGPLSIAVAQARLLAGQPDKALDAIRRTADTLYPAAIAASRARLEAIALFQDGRLAEALAVLNDIGGGAGLREELLWRARDWGSLARADMPSGVGADPVSQVRVLRRAIAYSMIGDTEALARMRGRYARLFVGKPTLAAFTVITADSGDAQTEGLATALASLPDASPAGADADLIDLSTAALTERKARPSSRD